ncbi:MULTISPECIES: DoxX family protein [unclassified Embleya]|uniref:DoxX family protein n=1 Tax=unclassified Embleya TaxID=2699296 RepID=UPI0033D18284
METAHKTLRRLARPLLATGFVTGGYSVLRDPGPLPALAERHGVPLPRVATRGTAAGMLIGGVALGAGFRPSLSIGLLAVCLVPTTVTVHDFWRQQDPVRRIAQRNEFFKNLSLLGGLAIAAADAFATGAAGRAATRAGGE